METVLVTGGTGLIGKQLCVDLAASGYRVMLLSRTIRKNPAYPTFFWDPESQVMDPEAMDQADYIIHLAGENIGAKRWTTTRKRQVLESRVRSGELLYQKIQAGKRHLKAFISASAIGYYGAITSDKIFTEADAAADDFLGSTCSAWEQASNAISSAGIRMVTLRIGVVLTAQGGALSKMILPTKYGMGSALGSGRQFMPWIHVRDLNAILLKSLEDVAMDGVYNAVSPQAITNIEFMRQLAAVLKKPFIMPAVPAFVIRGLLGEMSDMVLKGSRVSPDKLIRSGYAFHYPGLEEALRDLLVKEKGSGKRTP